MATRNIIAKDFDYTAKELKERIDDYFDFCKEEKIKPTDAALCRKIEITRPRFQTIKEYFESGKSDGEEHLQRDHSKLIYDAFLRLLDANLQRTDTPGIFYNKQPLFGFTDKQDGNLGEVKITIGMAGMKPGEDAFK